MEESTMKQKIKDAFFEPRAPQELIDSVILRAQAVTMGEEAKKQMATASAEQIGTLAAQALIGQLASVSALPSGSEPQALAQQLEQQPAFQAALHGGNVLKRVESGELMQQVANPQPEDLPEVPQKENPALNI